MSEQEHEEQNENEPDGREPVSFAELDPKYEARFNRIYGHMKENERINAQLVQDNRKLLQAVEEVKSTQVQDSQSQRLESIRAEKALAYEQGDFDQIARLDEEMVQIRTAAAPEPVQLEAQEPLQDSGLDPETEKAITDWSRELNDEGNFVRPWANPNHPKFDQAAKVGQAVLDDPNFTDTASILAEIERRMAETMPKKTQPAVLSGDGDIRPKEGGVKLTKDQVAISHVMFPKLSAKEAEAKYAKSMSELGA